ncbi:hypothetical protein DI005_07080 [Prauserella sp. PE36]|uniref:DUF5994 family protein n=1 Tax=Prauserella sp. PE36 TaxID=1504709 RepID=UPI000DE2DE18|nr:DUF5994 family protein [Prauserella sp. PE36]RBM22263.1 hypothetical protein DI005_07080 [Prauserella sp. PE36]
MPMVVAPSRGSLRLRMKPDGSASGYVDGAWWPRSWDLATELPELLAVLAARQGSIERVTYNLTRWEPGTRRLTVDGRVVRLEGFRSQHPGTVTVAGRGRRRLTLLVVPPEATPSAGHHALMTASRRDNVDSTDVLHALDLGADAAVPEPMPAATESWENDGGSRLR